IERSQPWLAGAAPERRLVDGDGKATRRQRGQDAGIAGPGDGAKFAGRSAQARDLEVAAEARKRPVEGAGEPRPTGLVAGGRGAAPLIGAVEEPDAGKAQTVGNGLDVGDIGRARALEPSPGYRIHGRQQPAHRRLEPAQAVVAQRARPRRALDGVANEP